MRFEELIRRSVAAAVLGAVAWTPVVAEGPKPAETARPRTPRRPFSVHHPLPFKFGERLVYDVKFSRFPVYANVGEVIFTVSELAGSARHVKFEVEAKSKGALVDLFNVDVHHLFTTLADRDDLHVYSSIRTMRENQNRLRQESVFDRDAERVRYTVAKPSAPSQPPTTVEGDARAWVQDIVSAVYFARTRKLKNEGREVAFYVNDEGQNFHIGIALAGRETIKTDVGSFKTLKVDARIFNGRLVRREGSLFVWLTDDTRRIPVKAQLKLPQGTATFEITKLDEGSKQIVPFRPTLEGEDE